MKTTLRRLRSLIFGSSPVRRAAQFVTLATASAVLAFGGNQYVVGYWQGQSTSVATPNVNQLTHLIYAFASVSSSAPYTCTVPPNMVSTLESDFTNFKKTNSFLKILISVGGENGSTYFSEAGAHPGFASNCVNSIMNSFTPGLIDGIDLDWEGPRAPANPPAIAQTDDTYKYNAILQDFRNALTAYWQANALSTQPILTAAIGPEGLAAYIDFTGASTNSSSLPTPVPGATNSVNFFNVMTYQYAGSWLCTISNNACVPGTSYTGANAPVSQVEADMNNLMSGKTSFGFATNIPASKLTIGIPFYAAEFTGVMTASASPVSYSQSTGNIGTLGQAGTFNSADPPYSSFQSQVSSSDLYRDTTGDAWIYTTGDILYAYDDATTVAKKVTWAEQKNLAGVMVWSLDQDATNEPLLAAIANAMPVTNSSNCGCIQRPGGGGIGPIAIDRSTYNFESGVQSWVADTTQSNVGVGTSSAVSYMGARSLAVSFNSATTGVNTQAVVYVLNSAMAQNGTVTFHVYIPVDAVISSVTAFISNTSYQWTTDPNTTTFTPGAWTTFTINVPADAMELGVSFDSSDNWTGVAYIDAVNYIAPQ